MAASPPPHAEGHGYGFPPGFATNPWVVQFNKSPKPPLTLNTPFTVTSSPHKLDIPALRGKTKTCIGQDGDWWLMCVEHTGHNCFLISFSDLSSKVPLPPLTKPNCFGCALSTQTPPDCTVVTTMYNTKSIWYCRPGNRHWSELSVHFSNKFESFTGVLVSGRNNSKGRIYATTTMGSMVVIDMSCAKAPHVERTSIKHHPNHRRIDHANYYSDYTVESYGDIFLIRVYLFGVPRVLVDLHAYRWNADRDEWDIVETVGDRTFFLGKRGSFAVTSATRAGTEPNCVHIVMRSGYNGFVIYTVSLEDMTIRVNVLEGSDKDLQVFWFVPSRFRQEPSTESIERKMTNLKIEDSEWIGSPNEWRPWSHLHTDLVELLVPKISFIDFLHLRAVCKQWSSISSNLIKHAKVLPLLVTTCPRRKDSLDVFDVVSKTMYNFNLNIPDEDGTGSQILWYSKNGWIILSRSCHSFYMVPLKRSPNDVIVLPDLDSYGIKGVSFSSTPGFPDFLVVTVQVNSDDTLITVKTWRLGDKDWSWKVFYNGIGFLMASHNPVFFGGNLYCLDVNGRIGVFNPDTMGLSVLPVATRSGGDMLASECIYSYLVEWKGELIAIFRADSTEEGAIEMYKLDRTQMVWSQLDGLTDAVVFWDRKNAHARPAPEEDFCNKMFLIPKYTEIDGGRAHTFYCFQSRQYHPSLYGHKEPINALWFEPNLDYLQ